MITADALLTADVSSKIKSFILCNIELYQNKKADIKKLEIANKKLFEYIVSLGPVTQNFIDYWTSLQIHNIEPLHTILLAAEYNDSYIVRHIVRMSKYSALLAEKVGLDSQTVQDIKYAATMHDIGKVGISDEILLKPRKLTVQEFGMIKNHTTTGANILAGASSAPICLAREIAFSHHEKWNGTGYPLGIRAEKIPIAAQIVGLLDVFDAITSERPYKPVYPVEVAWGFINIESGDHFAPDVVDVFLKYFDEFLQIKDEKSTTNLSSN